MFRQLALTLFTLVSLFPRFSSALDTREIFKVAEPSVVIVLASDTKSEKNIQGSGVLISPTEVATSCKVIEAAADIVVTQGSALRKAALRYKDSERDLCQLHIDDALPSGKPATGTPSSKSLESGQDLFAISAPRGLERTISRAMISGLRETPGTSGRLIQIDLQLSGGSIGGGVFDQDARLVGLVTPQFRQGENFTYVIPVDWIAELAQRNPDRLRATDATLTPAAGAVTSSATPVADATPAWMPRTGDRWKYKLFEGKRAAGTIVIDIAEVRGKTVKERITREDEKAFRAERMVDGEFNPVKFQEVITLPGGFQLSEISPYSSSEQGPKAGQRWQDIPVSLLLVWYGKKKFLLDARTVKQETVRVPAGTFTATLVEAVVKENLGSSVVTITCNYWYAPEVKRAVKMSLNIQHTVGALNSAPEIYELISFESAK